MRSSVSVILSSAPPDHSMSFPDYTQSPHDHRSLLVLVRQIGHQLKSKTFSRMFERMCRVHHVRLMDQQGNNRNVWLRYKKNYPVENNDWGDFQTHRRVLGLICIGKCSSQMELNEICRQHESMKVKYSSTLYDSRCIIFGINSDGTICETATNEPSSPTSNGPTPSENSVLKTDSSSSQSETSLERVDMNGRASPTPDPAVTSNSPVTAPFSEGTTAPKSSSEKSPPRSSENGARAAVPLSTPSNFKARPLFYSNEECCDNLEKDINEFICSLFWVLESKRLDKSHERQDKVPLLCAPFERKDFVGIDMDSRQNKKRCQGRVKKQMADLSLQAGLPVEAIGYYQTAAEMLKSVNDWLWLAACYEGMCASSVVVLYPYLGLNNQVQRIASFNTGSPIKNKAGTGSIHSLPNGLDPTDVKQHGKHFLSPSEIIDRYGEAVVQYGKYRHAGIIETEASIKAVLVLIEQQKYLEAAHFLQNVVFINLNLSDEEKIQRFTALSDLYNEIGFHRKAAFFRRVAAMRCVSPQNPQQNWSHCYSLLVQTLEGYNLSLDPVTFPRRDITWGWPILQIQILQELAGTSSRTGKKALSARHLAFLLYAMMDHLGPTERKEFAQQLESLAARSDGCSLPLTLDNGFLVPQVHFTNIPMVSNVKIMPPPSSLRPLKLPSRKEDTSSSPFIFSPIQYGSKRKNKNKADFSWVCGDTCEVTLEAENPFPFDLKMSSMSLLTDGLPFDSFPVNVTLPAHAESVPIKLMGTPKEKGDLKVLGYQHQTLGIKSSCRLRFLPCVRQPFLNVDIVSSLPQLQVSTPLPASAQPCATSQNMHLTLYNGQRQEVTLTLVNSSTVPVELLELSLETVMNTELQNEFFQWSSDNVSSQLPIAPGSSAGITLYVKAVTDFVSRMACLDEVETGSWRSGSQPNSLFSSQSLGFSSTPSVQPRYPFTGSSKLPSNASTGSKQTPTYRTDSTASLHSLKSSGSLRSSSSGTSATRREREVEMRRVWGTKTVEASLKIKYSGGEGMKDNYSRVCNVSLVVEVLPSIHITHWDVLPADMATHCYLVLDVLNLTNHEMEMKYAPGKCIFMEGGESCRFPVPVEKCPLEKLSQIEESDLERIEAVCTDHIAGLVDLKWNLESLGLHGSASVKNITWSPLTLDLIRVSPIHWDIVLNGNAWSGLEELSLSLGSSLQVDITLVNQSLLPLSHLLLRADCYQDHMNGSSNYRLDTKLNVVGSDRCIVDEIAVGGKYTHTLCLFFFTPGNYKLDLQCTTGVDGMTDATHYENLPLKGGVSAGTGHTWKSTPPVEIHVIV